MTRPLGFPDEVSFVRGVAHLLRGDVKAHEYGRVILPLVVLRRLECALAQTTTEWWPRVRSSATARAATPTGVRGDVLEVALCRASWPSS